MSNFSWYSLFGQTDDQTNLLPVGPSPPQRDRSFSTQFFSFFGDESEPATAGAAQSEDSGEPGLQIRDSPVAKTLSEMAQTFSDLADETIRTFSPAPPPVVQPPKISYRRKTVFAPTGHLTDPDNPGGSLLASLQEDPPKPSTSEFSHRFPSYNKTKQAEETPLLTSFSKNRSSFKLRDSAVERIASKAKTQLEAPTEAFTVSNLTGLPPPGPPKPAAALSRITEEGNPSPDVRVSSPNCKYDADGNVIRTYDSDNFLEMIAMESDEDDIVDMTYNFNLFDPVPPLREDSGANYDFGSLSSLGDNEPMNLIGETNVFK